MRGVLGLLGAMLAGTALAAEPQVVAVQPVIETTALPDNAFESDADDPAIWVHPTRPADSLVVTGVKDGGMRVYDLAGRTMQVIDPAETPQGTGRINNVDVAHGFLMPDGSRIDLAVASDRALDVIRVFRIRPNAGVPLVEVTAFPGTRAFPIRPRANGQGLIANPLDDQNTAYGLALWHDRDAEKLVAVVTQRGKARLGLFRLFGRADGTVRVQYERDWRFPVVFRGQDLRIEDEENPLRDWSPQFEGLVVDQRSGRLFAGQEDVGIWLVDLKSGARARRPFYTTRGAEGRSFRVPGSRISRDVEGLCIYYGPGRSGYLIASSQGNAHGETPNPEPPYDDSFVVFDLATPVPSLRGSFRVRRAGPIDATQESDGADVLSFGLPGFDQGLFVTQDGYNDDLNGLRGEPEASNFKYVPWQRIARAFEPPLLIAPRARDPRQP